MNWAPRLAMGIIICGCGAAAADHHAPGLFDSHEVLTVTLTGPFKDVVRDRDPEPPEHDMTLTVGGQALAVKVRPRGLKTLAPPSRQREARMMSWVITMSPSPARSAIQSSAASKRPSSFTTSSRSHGSVGMRSHWAATSKTFRPYRFATLYVSSLTGQESAST